MNQTQTLTLTLQTTISARILLLWNANEQANKALEYVELGWNACAANAAQLAFRYSRAWHEIAFGN